MVVDKRLEVKRDSNYKALPMDPSDVVEPDYAHHEPPSEGSRRCMIYRSTGDTVER